MVKVKSISMTFNSTCRTVGLAANQTGGDLAATDRLRSHAGVRHVENLLQSILAVVHAVEQVCVLGGI